MFLELELLPINRFFSRFFPQSIIFNNNRIIDNNSAQYDYRSEFLSGVKKLWRDGFVIIVTFALLKVAILRVNCQTRLVLILSASTHALIGCQFKTGQSG